MKIQGSGIYGHEMPAAANRKATGSEFAAKLGSAASAGSTSQAALANFADMTGQELFDWMNDRIKAGDLSLSDTSCMLGFTPGATLDVRSASSRGSEKVDFFRLAQDGIFAAREGRDAAGEGIYQAALAIMQKYQLPAQP